jgi:transposase
MSKNYPSNLSREQFEWIRPILEEVKKKTKPRQLDLYEVFCGVVYVLKSGCSWRMLPKDFPKWRSTYEYFRKWSQKPSPHQKSALEKCLKKISKNLSKDSTSKE